MKHSKFIYDENDFQFLKGSRGAGHRLLNALKWVILTVLVSSFFYVLLSLAFWSEGRTVPFRGVSGRSGAA